jgi:hypothetical protein
VYYEEKVFLEAVAVEEYHCSEIVDDHHYDYFWNTNYN